MFPLDREFPPLPVGPIPRGGEVAQAVRDVAEAFGQRRVWERFAARFAGENVVTADHRIKLHPAALALGPMAIMALGSKGRLKAKSDLELFRDLYELFRAVRQILASTEWLKTTRGITIQRFSFLNAYVFSRNHRTGRLSVTPWPVLQEFITALHDLEDDRLRRCPVCGGFFYAIRANTQACEAHRILARVRKNRGQLAGTPGRIVKATKAKGRSSIIAATPAHGTAPVVRKRRASRP